MYMYIYVYVHIHFILILYRQYIATLCWRCRWTSEARNRCCEKNLNPLGFQGKKAMAAMDW